MISSRHFRITHYTIITIIYPELHRRSQPTNQTYYEIFDFCYPFGTPDIRVRPHQWRAEEPLRKSRELRPYQWHAAGSHRKFERAASLSVAHRRAPKQICDRCVLICDAEKGPARNSRYDLDLRAHCRGELKEHALQHLIVQCLTQDMCRTIPKVDL